MSVLNVKKKDGSWQEILVIKGEQGKDGLSAYEIAKKHGFTGTETEWNDIVNKAKNDAEAAAQSASQSLSSLNTLVEQKKTEIQNKGKEVLDSLPDEYEELASEVSLVSESVNDLISYAIRGVLTIGVSLRIAESIDTYGIYHTNSVKYLSADPTFYESRFLKKIKYTGMTTGRDNTPHTSFIYEYNGEKEFIKRQPLIIGTNAQTITLSEGTEFVRFGFGYGSTSGKEMLDVDIADFEICIVDTIFDIINKNIESSFKFSGGEQSKLPSTDSSLFPAQTCYYLSKAWLTDAVSYDFVSTSFFLFTIGTEKYYKIQIVIIPADGRVYIRNNTTASTGQINMSKYKLLGDNRNGNYFAFGDSLTEGILNGNKGIITKYPYPESVGKVCNLTLNNCAHGGQGFINTQYYSTNAIEEVRKTNISNADLITLAWGRNDSGKPLGTSSDTSGAETICGKLKEILEYIESQNPSAQVIVITPLPSGAWFNVKLPGNWTVDEMTEEFEKICKPMCIPVIGYRNLSICKESKWRTVTNDADRVHPTDTGYKKISSYLSGLVSAYFKNQS